MSYALPFSNSPMVSIADPYDLVLRDVILRSIEHEISDIRPRDFETKTGQVALSHAVLSSVRLVCKFRWSHHRPVEIAFLENSFHGGCIGDNGWKKQPPQQICRGHDGILEQESYGLDHDALDSGRDGRIGFGHLCWGVVAHPFSPFVPLRVLPKRTKSLFPPAPAHLTPTR